MRCCIFNLPTPRHIYPTYLNTFILLHVYLLMRLEISGGMAKTVNPASFAIGLSTPFAMVHLSEKLIFCNTGRLLVCLAFYFK